MQLRISSAADLVAALMAPDMGTRMAVLRAIQKDPERALAFGKYEGQDVIDVLIHLGYQEHRYTYWKMLLDTLALYRDSRVTFFFKKLITLAERPEILGVAARYLSGEPAETVYSHLSALLHGETQEARLRAVATVLASAAAPLLTSEEQVRVGLLREEGAPPPCDEAHIESWLAELGGERADRARALLEAQGEPAFLALKSRWNELSEENREWILRWGARAHPVDTVDLLTEALRSGDPRRVCTALECVPQLGPAGALFAPMISRLREHPEESIRVAAERAATDEG